MTRMFQSNANPVVIVIASAFMIIGALAFSDAAAQSKPSAGEAASKPTSAPAVVGWRGDGTGQYPNCNPPTQWYLKENGESKNILWKTKLPYYSWATPIIVGDKIITRSEPYDLICLDKNTGKLLWMHSLPALIGVTDEEMKANPALKPVANLLEQLEQVNNQFVKNSWSQDICNKKNDLQKQINEKMTAIDSKYTLPRDWYLESWSGYTASTPCSDGQNIYFTSGNGIIACYDLDGNKKWAQYESLVPIWGEHGSAASPTVAGNIFLAPSLILRGLDKTTGAEIWQQKCPGGGTTIPFNIGGTDFVIYGWNFIRVRDGKSMLPRLGIGGGFFHDNMIYEGGSHASFYRVEPKPNEGLSITPLIAEEYNRVTIRAKNNPKAISDPKGDMACFSTASPLYDNGLLYCVGNFGWMAVLDTKKTKQNDTLVYTNLPGFDFKHGYERKTLGMGICASPILAGKYIYMMDSGGCTLVMAPGREYKQIAKNNIECTVPGEARYYTGPHQELTEASMIADGKRLYIRGEQFLYCIGEK